MALMHASAARELLCKSIVSDQMRNCLMLLFAFAYAAHNTRVAGYARPSD